MIAISPISREAPIDASRDRDRDRRDCDRDLADRDRADRDRDRDRDRSDRDLTECASVLLGFLTEKLICPGFYLSF